MSSKRLHLCSRCSGPKAAQLTCRSLQAALRRRLADPTNEGGRNGWLLSGWAAHALKGAAGQRAVRCAVHGQQVVRRGQRLLLLRSHRLVPPSLHMRALAALLLRLLRLLLLLTICRKRRSCCGSSCKAAGRLLESSKGLR